MKSIFLSHNHADKDFALRLAAGLRERGVYVWIDDAEIKVGDSLVSKIREGIDRVDYFGIILSSSSVKSEWVSKELDLAMNQEIEGRRVKVLPLLLETCNLPSFLIGKLYADFRSSFEDGLQALLGRLGVDDLTTPHQPMLRSHEIPIATSSRDQVPRLAVSGERILLQWFEEYERRSVIYIYTLEPRRFEFVNATAYEMASEVVDHFLVVTSNAVGSFAVVTDDWQTFDLWYLDLSEKSRGNPIKVDCMSKQVDSIVALESSFLLSSTAQGLLTLAEIGTDGSVIRQTSNDSALKPIQSYLVPFGKEAQAVLETTDGIAIVSVGQGLVTGPSRIAVPTETSISAPIDLDVHIYDNCSHRDGEYTQLLHHKRRSTSSELGICTLGNAGRDTESKSLAIRCIHGSPFKQSMGIGNSAFLVVWNEVDEDYRTALLRCMLFEKQSLKPLWSYERTLTSRSNYSSGVPAVVIGNKCYIAYLEESGEYFKVKLTEVDLHTEMPVVPKVMRWG